MMSRKNISSGAIWEDIVGYSRAVEIGNTIEISGTVARITPENATNAYLQAMDIIERAKEVLESVGASLEDVVRTRMFAVNREDFDQIAQAHSHYFKTIKPTTGFYVIKELVSPEYLIEIEFTAIKKV